MNESSHIYVSRRSCEWVMSYMSEWASHDACEYVMWDMSAQCHICDDMREDSLTACEWVKSYMSESWRMWMSHVIYKWVMTHVNVSCHIWVRERVMTHVNESCHIWVHNATYAMTCARTRSLHVSESSHIWASHDAFEWVMSYMSAKWHMCDDSLTACEWGMSHARISHVACEWVQSYMSEWSCNLRVPAPCKCIMSHMNESSYTDGSCHVWLRHATMGWLRLVGFLKLQVSFAKEPYKRDYILQKRPMILRSLLIVATPYEGFVSQVSEIYESCHIWMNEACHIWMNEACHIWMNEACHIWMNEACHIWMNAAGHIWMNEACHIWMNEACHIWMNEACHIWMNAAGHIWMNATYASEMLRYM